MRLDGATASAHQAGFRFYVQRVKGHDAACQRRTKEGQRQEFFHGVSPFKITMPLAAKEQALDLVILSLSKIFPACSGRCSGFRKLASLGVYWHREGLRRLD